MPRRPRMTALVQGTCERLGFIEVEERWDLPSPRERELDERKQQGVERARPSLRARSPLLREKPRKTRCQGKEWRSKALDDAGPSPVRRAHR